MSGDELYLGTEPMRNGLELDPKAVENYFNHLFPFLEENLSISQFRGGQSNPTYRVISGKHAWVIRRKPPGPLLPSAHAIDREYRVLSALGKTNVPVPKTYNLCMDENILGTPFYVMECVNGPVYWDALLPGKTMETRGVVYDSMNASIAKLHQADFEFLELGDFGRPGNYVDRQLKRWGRQYLEADFERILEMDLLIEWLEDFIAVEIVTEEMIEEIIRSEIEMYNYRSYEEIDLLEFMGRACPAFGMIGTVVGLILMLGSTTSGGADIAGVMGGMSVALITTLYGVLLAQIIFLPIASKRYQIKETQVLLMEMMREGLLYLKRRELPETAAKDLVIYLPPKLRKKILLEEQAAMNQDLGL